MGNNLLVNTIKSELVSMNIYSISDEYGFWHPSGRNLFFKFPKFSFIDIIHGPVLAGDYFLLENLKSISLDELFGVGSQRKIYIRNNGNYSLLKKIIDALPSCLLRYGKYVNGVAISSISEIMIGVKENPESSKEALLKELKSNCYLSKFSRIRPVETYDD